MLQVILRLPEFAKFTKFIASSISFGKFHGADEEKNEIQRMEKISVFVNLHI